MTSEVRKDIERYLLRGEEVNQAYRLALKKSNYLEIETEGIEDIPPASCVAEHLKGIRNPNKDDLKRAFDACLSLHRKR